MNLLPRAVAPADRLVVRLIARSPSERMNPKQPEPWVLEAGFEGLTAADRAARAGTVRERGRMVSVFFTDDARLPEAMHILADLWDRQHRRDAGLRRDGRLPCDIDIPLAGQRGTIVTDTGRLADDLHFVADAWIRERRVFRIRTRRAMAQHAFEESVGATLMPLH